MRVTDLEKLRAIVSVAHNSANEWMTPKGISIPAMVTNDRDFHRGVYSALGFVLGQIKSIKRKKKKL